MKTLAAVLGLATLALAATPARAHHGWSGYDSSKELTLTGTIKDAGYEHPHGGTQATVVGYPNRTDPDEMRAERITIAGKTTELR
jgi:hypothetical protein